MILPVAIVLFASLQLSEIRAIEPCDSDDIKPSTKQPKYADFKIIINKIKNSVAALPDPWKNRTTGRRRFVKKRVSCRALKNLKAGKTENAYDILCTYLDSSTAIEKTLKSCRVRQYLSEDNQHASSKGNISGIRNELLNALCWLKLNGSSSSCIVSSKSRFTCSNVYLFIKVLKIELSKFLKKLLRSVRKKLKGSKRPEERRKKPKTPTGKKNKNRGKGKKKKKEGKRKGGKARNRKKKNRQNKSISRSPGYAKPGGSKTVTKKPRRQNRNRTRKRQNDKN